MDKLRRDLMREAFDQAVRSVRPDACLSSHLPAPPKGRTLVVGAGKAAAAMAQTLDAHWPKDAPLDGLAITRHGHGAPTTRISVIEAGHPVPDTLGEEAARSALEQAEALGADDLLLCLLSGGGSSVMAAPAKGLTLGDKQDLTTSLLRSGASIDEINCVRKHLSAIKGGRLAAAAAPARVVTLMISDVAGDNPAVIASGPTVADPTTVADARSVLKKYRINPPPRIAHFLGDEPAETPKSDDPVFRNTQAVIIANADDALAAAEPVVQAAGYQTILLGGHLSGDAQAVAQEHAALVLDPSNAGTKFALISGGELTVTVTGEGRGGPNQHYLLALALALKGRPGIHALACDTDGIDGSEDNAGAWIGPDTLAQARHKGLDAEALLRDNNSHEFFRKVGNLILTGPTRTNVNDFRIILIDDL